MLPSNSRKNSPKFVHRVSTCTAIPRLLNIYLCLHGLANPVKFKLKCKNMIFFAAPTLFIITNEINKLYCILIRFTSLENRRNNNVLTLIKILECLLRIQFFLKRKHLKYLNHNMAKIYSTIIPYTMHKYRNVLIIVLIINDICTLSIIVSWNLTLDLPLSLVSLARHFFFWICKSSVFQAFVFLLCFSRNVVLCNTLYS